MKVFLLTAVIYFSFSFDIRQQENKHTSIASIPEKGLFDSDEIFTITLKGNTRQLLNDRGDKPAYHLITLSYREKDSSEVTWRCK